MIYLKTIFGHLLIYAYTDYTVALYSKCWLCTVFFLSTSTPHKFSFLHWNRVCVRSQTAKHQVKEEPALERLGPAEGHTLEIHRVHAVPPLYS